MAAVAPIAVLAAASSLPWHHPRHRAPAALLGRIARSNPAALTGTAPIAQGAEPRPRPFTPGLRVTPSTFGADPTGRKDSWAAITAAVGQCINQSTISPNGFFPGEDTTPSFGPIRDMGGCDIDLEGGEYRISKPVTIPEMNANMQLGRGSLIAAPGFAGDFLIVVGKKGSCRVPQGSCNIDINFPELFLDGAHLASGMEINNVMGVTIGPGGYFLNFTQYGLQINAGHEVMMDRTWLGETNFDFDHVKLGVKPNATAIQINGNDHYILNTIVFSSKVGLEVNGAADYITGVHVWFPVNHAVHFPDSMAFHVTGNKNRFNGCYMDGGRAIFEKGALNNNIWTNGFECCQNGAPASGTMASGITLVGDSVGPGLMIMNNVFAGGSIYHCSSRSADGRCAQPQQQKPAAATAPRPPNCPASLNASAAGKECQGLRRAPAKSLADCEKACCADDTCTVYQFCPDESCDGATPGDGAQCWTGSWAGCGSGSRKGWAGMGTAGVRPAGPISVKGVRIAHNSFGHTAQTTQATLSLTQTAATKWAFDFCDVLLFPQIAVAKVHVMAAEGFPTAVARPTQDCKLLVETASAVTGTVTVEVDSSEPSKDFL